MGKIKIHRRLAHKLGYDLEKFNRQVTVDTHLRELLPRLNIDLVLDVGANTGQFGHALRDIGYEGQILSFEPGAAAFQQLEDACRQDSQWLAHKMALSTTEGEVELLVSEASVFSSIHASNEYGAAKFGDDIATDHKEMVPMQRLETFIDTNIKDFSKRKVLLKMDTQGHDRDVFTGAGKYRDKFSALQSEISVLPIYEGTADYMEMLAMFREFEYEVTGLYTVSRHRKTGHIIELDCVMVPLKVIEGTF